MERAYFREGDKTAWEICALKSTEQAEQSVKQKKTVTEVTIKTVSKSDLYGKLNNLQLSLPALIKLVKAGRTEKGKFLSLNFDLFLKYFIFLLTLVQD
jgi:hypothetical protein